LARRNNVTGVIGGIEALIEKILFPVDFSASCSAMSAFVKRAAAMFGSEVALLHVCDLSSYNGFELYVRTLPEIEGEH
jgi:nucleotide-binding universal stress UspA family protein